LTSSGEVVSGRLGNLGAILATANYFAVHMMHGVASARKDFQCCAFAALIDLKYPCLESLAIALSCGSFEARAFREDEWNSFSKIENSGDHHGMALMDGQGDVVCVLRSSISMPRWESNHSSKACLVGRAGDWGIMVSLS